MPTTLKQYDPAKVQVSIGGSIITGYAQGTFINLVRNVNNWAWQVSPDGQEGVRSKTNDRSALLTFTLAQTSLGNELLANAANEDEISGDRVYPVTITDLNGATLFESAKGWIEKPADASFAQDGQPRAWQIRLAEVAMRHAGNPEVAALESQLA